MTDNMPSPFQFGDVFTLFRELPLELREMVWKMALPRPRMVTVSAEQVHPRDITRADIWSSPYNPGYYNLLSDARAVPCGLFHACQESRAVALRRYSLAFEGELGTPLYIDWLGDTLCLESFQAMYYLSDRPRRRLLGLERGKAAPIWQGKIHHIALRGHLWGLGGAPPCGIQYLSSFPKLQTLMIKKLWPAHDRERRGRRLSEFDDKRDKGLHRWWMDELDTNDESKLPRITWLEPDDFQRKMEEEKVACQLFRSSERSC